jgi:hypothetical protein
MRLLHTKLGIKKTRCVFVFFMVNVCVYETVYEGTVESERRIYKDKEIGFVRVCTLYVCNFRSVSAGGKMDQFRQYTCIKQRIQSYALSSTSSNVIIITE